MFAPCSIGNGVLADAIISISAWAFSACVGVFWCRCVRLMTPVWREHMCYS